MPSMFMTGDLHSYRVKTWTTLVSSVVLGFGAFSEFFMGFLPSLTLNSEQQGAIAFIVPLLFVLSVVSQVSTEIRLKVF